MLVVLLLRRNPHENATKEKLANEKLAYISMSPVLKPEKAALPKLAEVVYQLVYGALPTPPILNCMQMHPSSPNRQCYGAVQTYVSSFSHGFELVCTTEAPCMYVHACMHVCLHVCIYLFVGMYVCMCVCILL